MEAGYHGPHGPKRLRSMGRQGEDGLTGSQLSAFRLAGRQPSPVPPLREEQEKPMTRFVLRCRI